MLSVETCARVVCPFGAVALVLAAACGGGGSSTLRIPTTPTMPAPPAPSTPTYTWSAEGQIVALGSAEGVGSAVVTPGWSLPAVTADAQGNYQLGDVADPPSTPYPVTLSAAGMISHDVWITWARGPRTGVNLDMIRDAAPFSLEFYRQFVRDTYDNSPGSPWRLLRWTSAPSFYVRTVDQNGRAVEPEVVAVTIDALRRGVPAFTAGRYSAAVIESGTDERPEATDWINVNFRREGRRGPCGTSFVGRNPGVITLYLEACDCGSIKVAGETTLHEVGHAMGFFHVGDRRSVMYPMLGSGCPAGALSAAEIYHAAIAYSRPRGNTDPDRDPSSMPTLTGTMLGSHPWPFKQ